MFIDIFHWFDKTKQNCDTIIISNVERKKILKTYLLFGTRCGYQVSANYQWGKYPSSKND